MEVSCSCHIGHGAYCYRHGCNAPENLSAAMDEVCRLRKLINSPQTDNWMESVQLEAAHQQERWGVKGDVGKTPLDWFWLLGYLAGKAVAAFVAGDPSKGKHHIVSSSAMLLNWHRHVTGEITAMRPGIDPSGVRVDAPRDLTPMIDAAMVEMSNIYPPLRRSECERLIRAAGVATVAPAQPLTVWFGPMPESNGKTNWTAILHRGDLAHGFTIERSEHHDRVRYEADRVRHLIGELAEEPDVLAYDADMLSPPGVPVVQAQSKPTLAPCPVCGTEPAHGGRGLWCPKAGRDHNIHADTPEIWNRIAGVKEDQRGL